MELVELVESLVGSPCQARDGSGLELETIREEYESNSLTGRSCVGLCMGIESSLTRGGTRFNSATG